MSEYQYYDFCSINKPLSAEARKEMRSLSSRAQVGTHTASYVYNYGDFRGNPKQLVLKYFDVFFYISNFGTLELLFKYPVNRVDLLTLKKYETKHLIEIEQHNDKVLVNITLTNEEGFGWTEGEGMLADLLPLYDELIRHNYHCLRLVLAINDTLTSKNDEAISQLLAEDNLASEAEQALLECFEITY